MKSLNVEGDVTAGIEENPAVEYEWLNDQQTQAGLTG
jgi:hypothetical protein